MPMTPGLNPAIRQILPTLAEEPEGATVPLPEESSGSVLTIEHDDGSVSISLDGKPVEDVAESERSTEWFRNLVDDLDMGILNQISDDLLKGVQDDLDSRNGTKVGGERISRKRIDPGQRVSIAKHDYTLEYSPVDNGAVGPPVIEDEVDQFMNASLLQRANLQRKVSFEEAKRSGVKKPTPPTPQPKPGQKRWS